MAANSIYGGSVQYLQNFFFFGGGGGGEGVCFCGQMSIGQDFCGMLQF